jgi:hypothetical protein
MTYSREHIRRSLLFQDKLQKKLVHRELKLPAIYCQRLDGWPDNHNQTLNIVVTKGGKKKKIAVQNKVRLVQETA